MYLFFKRYDAIDGKYDVIDAERQMSEPQPSDLGATSDPTRLRV